MSTRVIDTLKREKLLEIISELNIELKGKNYFRNDDLKNLIINALKNTATNYQNKKYIFPKVKKLVAIGDLHGDLVATIKALKLAQVIDKNLSNTTRDINKIQWIGGKTVIVQLGDQIDRVRPAKLINNLCPENDSEINADEGSDLKIICLFEKLHKEAVKQGGAVYSILGNHELMNVDCDFRYVSPREFREFGNHFKEPRTNDTSYPYGYESRKKAFEPGGIISKKLAQFRYSVLQDGLPLGYYHRLKAFERGGSLSCFYAENKKSVVQVGSWLFVHGGISLKCAESFLLNDINYNVSCWLDGKKSPQIMNYIQNVYHNDDENMSPFWTRVYSDLDQWDEYESSKEFLRTIDTLNINNKRNNNNMIRGMIVGHSPQFMYNKGLNSACNNKLWRTDVGMSRAFGKINSCSDRKVQVLVIVNDSQFKILQEE